MLHHKSRCDRASQKCFHILFLLLLLLANQLAAKVRGQVSANAQNRYSSHLGDGTVESKLRQCKVCVRVCRRLRLNPTGSLGFGDV